MDLKRAAGDAARIGHRDEQLQINQVETHGYRLVYLPSSWPKA
jgi:hypothetical protein